ncbi:MAG: YidC/Oxa1 family membrane protein insertase [Lachnospiraceae bacterium]|uniref:YidC/Oxa1 family membrane protein insertase n=1 Tax=Candidatus Merdisoma sp. JLR.KK011 TaxID=3114299 RepID=UPI0029D7EE89|nr:YidC/Oxa1 family membrane protein insertase [Lachnospiraceae bacterium]MCI9384073.1 YidC/Oxa1 family membrane protein insertase [Lachnospiraceae bacterium]MCI9478297.1 YidC/Oxa1 family membrane protein insertase [Lachnospiraceae bacterium]MCI9621820.1 YidC/Oxa1 family membrane protein insertase [Lachnospiraceae bacterium]
MTSLFLTQDSRFILGDIAKILGWIINVIFDFLDSVGIANVGFAIILFTIIVYMLMIPLTYKQQKFSRMSMRMNPEIQAIQKKYKGKQDQASMLKMQDETKAVYAKYGTSPTGTCLPMLVQLPVLLAVYAVVYAIPAYIDKIKMAYYPLVTDLLNTAGGSAFIQGLKSAASFQKRDFALENTIIDVLNKATTAEWESIAAEFPSLSGVVESTQHTLSGFNNFLGLNIVNSPWYTIKESFSEGNYLWIIVALLIPVLAGLSQWFSLKLMPQAGASGDGENNEMMQSMKMMNNFMPLMSVYFCAILPVGVGIYWIMSAVVRTIQQLVINKQLSKMDIDEEIKKNIEAYNRKREKNGLPPERLNSVARTSTRNVEPVKREITSEERQRAIQDSTAYYNKGAAKPGSLAAKARMVEQYNEKNSKGKNK